MPSRRKFLATTATGISIAALYPFGTKANLVPVNQPGNKGFLQMGFAGYTFANYNIEQSINIMQRVGINTFSIKDFHLPLGSTKEQMDVVIGLFAAAGITIYAAGVIYMKTEQEVDRAFDYARRAGFTMIVGAPNYELLPYIEQKVKSLNIRLAIHNHGPEDKLYAGPKEVYDKIKDMDKRIGICLDIGHATRAGVDPVQAVTLYATRIFDMHIKDVSAAVVDGKAIELGRGVIDIPALQKALRKINYTGKCSIEYEKDMKDSLAGIAESVGFFRGVMQAI